MTHTPFVLPNGQQVRIFSLRRLARTAHVDLEAIPFAGRILLEALLRSHDP